MAKPEFVFGGTNDPDFILSSPDGQKTVKVSLSNDGVMTIDDTPIFTVEESGFEETLYDNNNRVTNIITWTDSNKTQKIHEEIVTYTQGKVSQIQTDYYNSNGVKIKTVTQNFNYQGNKIISIERTVS